MTVPSSSSLRKLRRPGFLLLLAFLAFGHWKGWFPTERSDSPVLVTTKGPPARPSPKSPHAPPSHAPAEGTSRSLGVWEELHGCTLAEDRNNDGDSFDILHNGKRHTFRLYFVDCPEKVRHYQNGPRLEEQGRYFGGLTEAQTVQAGELAREYSLGLMRRHTFTVLTKWEAVYDSGRSYAFVRTAEGDLAHLLVAKGLARIYTKGEDRPGGPTAKEEKRELQVLEQKARLRGEGAWGRR